MAELVMRLPKIQRYKPFKSTLEDLLLKNTLRKHYINKKSLQKTTIDIIMPTHNRSDLIINAVDSIKKQLHQHWKLYICDDGSTDDTIEKCKQYKGDHRIKYLKLAHKGVSSARNSGLQQANSNYVAFLDSDNKWSPEYLSLMIAFMDKFSLNCAYCAARLISNECEQWLGDFFSWQACLEMNYIDLNCFIQKTSVNSWLFDKNLERYVDWDYILYATKSARVSYLPSPLVNYCNDQARHRISTTKYQTQIDASRAIKYIANKHCQSMGCNENLDARLIDDNNNRFS